LNEEQILDECRRALSLATQASSETLTVIASQITIEAASDAADDSLIRETVGRLRVLAQHAGSATTKARASATEGFCLMEAGDFHSALNVFERASTALRERRLESELARALNGHGICAMAVGQHRAALKSFSESMKVAERLHDLDHKITVLGNIGLAHEELGSYDTARDRYADAVELATRSSTPRRSALAYANAANIAVITGDLASAADLITIARSAATESQLRQLSSLVDFTEADLHLAMREPELAWRLISTALSPRQPRLRAIDNNGKAARLTMHCIFATRGPEALREHFRAMETQLPQFRLSDRLEVAAFVVWLSRVIGVEMIDGNNVRDEIESLGLRGILGILRAVGTAPEGW
jgi:tetratricopeptide (TPR) repeat protein